MINVMVTASGGSPGQGIIKAIKRSGLDCRIVTLDGNPEGPGLYRGDAGYLVKLAKEEGFIKDVIDICNKEKIDIILVGTDYELTKFAKNKARIESKTDAIVVVSTPEQIAIADDKWLTFKFLKENDLPYIPTVKSEDAEKLIKEIGFPLIIKPRIGDSSRDIFIVNDRKELVSKLDFLLNRDETNEFLDKNIGYIVQKYVGEEKDEYTSTAVCFDKKCYGVISMDRDMRYPGHTTRAVVKKFPKIDKFIENIAVLFDAYGPCNFQCRVIDSVPYVFEINCRFSGTTGILNQVGYENVKAIINKVALGKEPKQLTFNEGLVVRYFNELFIPLPEVEQVKKNKQVKDSKSKAGKWL